MATVSDVDAKLEAHVDVCAVRYQGLDEQIRGVNARLKRLEQIIISFAGGVMLLMAGILMKGH